MKTRSEIGFCARLDSPAFPLKRNTECKLHLTFEYGADEPYQLVFEPLDKSFPPVRATWRRTVEEILTDASYPPYPKPLSWKELEKVPKPGSEETSNFLEWVVDAISQLLSSRRVGTLYTPWYEDKNGCHYAYARCKDGTEVFIHECNFANGFTYQDFAKGDEISFKLREGKDGRFRGSQIASVAFDEEEAIRKDLEFTQC